jgi:hypothetical protein
VCEQGIRASLWVRDNEKLLLRIEALQALLAAREGRLGQPTRIEI